MNGQLASYSLAYYSLAYVVAARACAGRARQWWKCGRGVNCYWNDDGGRSTVVGREIRETGMTGVRR